MKVNKIYQDFATKTIPSRQINKLHLSNNYISFRGGNSGDVLHVVAEKPPYSKKGGVATVANDYNTLPNISATESGVDTFVIPYYNGAITYDETGELVKSVDVLRVPANLPEGHKLKGKEGRAIYTSQDLDKKSLNDIINGVEGKDFWILEEISSKTMQWGFEDAAPIKLFRVPNTNDFMVYTEATASMKEPYATGGYSTTNKPFVSTWSGDPYAKFDKAGVEFIQEITKAVPGYDPGTVVCSDSQAAYISHYMAERNAQNEDFFQIKKPTQVIHNGGDGYIGKTSPRNMLVNIATKEQLETIIESNEYLDALRNGREDEFLLSLLEPLVGKNQDSVSAMDIPIYYAKLGYVPMITGVSEKYAEAVIKNKEVAPSLQKKLQELDSLGRFAGIINPLNDPTLAPDQPLPAFMPGYRNGATVTLENGDTVEVKAFRYFDSDKLTNLEHVEEVKNENKINLFDRLSGKYEGSDKYALVVAGRDGASVKVHGKIDTKYIDKIKNGEKVRLYTSWGRGDFQKAMDTVMDSFVKYVELTGDENAVFIIGGPLEEGTPDKINIINKIDEILKNPKMQGRFAYFEGFAPGLALTSAADMAVLPSRTAPCELTDLEAMKKLCTTNVSNCQGLAQKNFDPEGENSEFANGYVTEHEFFMSEEEALLAGAGTTAAAAFIATKAALEKKEITKLKLRVGEEITPEALRSKVEAHKEYKESLKALRDDIISSELAQNMKRKKEETRETAQKILKNQAEMQTGWETNGKLSKTKKSSGELYRTLHFRKTGRKIEKNETLISRIQESISKKIKIIKQKSEEVIETTIKTKSNKGKFVLIGAISIVAGMAINHLINKNRQNTPKENKPLSMIA